MCGSMVDIKSPAAEIRQGKKEETRKKHDQNIMSASATQGGHKEEKEKRKKKERKNKPHILNKYYNVLFYSVGRPLLLRRRERLRSIVMSMSVCLSVREDISMTRDLCRIFMHIAYVRGSVILRHVDDRPHRLSAGRGHFTVLRFTCVYVLYISITVYCMHV